MNTLVMIGALLYAVGASPAIANAKPDHETIGTIHLMHEVMADAKPLPAGTYQVRLTGDFAKPANGQSAEGERWVEFLKAGQVVGRELATVVSSSDIAAIVKGPRPGPNQSRVDVLKGGDYVRVWINRSEANYIINLPPAPDRVRP